MAWDHGMVESQDYEEAPAERARTQDELPTSTIGRELDLDLLPVDIGRRDGRGDGKEPLSRAQLILRRQQR